MDKVPFDIDVAMDRVRETVKELPKAVMFELAEEGYNSPFEQLVACIISQRTKEEVTVVVARKLFQSAQTPADMITLSPEQIDRLITPSTFHEVKALQIHKIAQQILHIHGGRLPCDYETLTSFRGIGPKCANLILGIACGQNRIGVDIHVHRVTNRWGYIRADTPENSTIELEKKLPPKYWIEINRLLVPFGKYICTGQLPKCSTCPLLDMCRQVGVTKHR